MGTARGLSTYRGMQVRNSRRHRSQRRMSTSHFLCMHPAQSSNSRTCEVGKSCPARWPRLAASRQAPRPLHRLKASQARPSPPTQWARSHTGMYAVIRYSPPPLTAGARPALPTQSLGELLVGTRVRCVGILFARARPTGPPAVNHK